MSHENLFKKIKDFKVNRGTTNLFVYYIFFLYITKKSPLSLMQNSKLSDLQFAFNRIKGLRHFLVLMLHHEHKSDNVTNISMPLKLYDFSYNVSTKSTKRKTG